MALDRFASNPDHLIAVTGEWTTGEIGVNRLGLEAYMCQQLFLVMPGRAVHLQRTAIRVGTARAGLVDCLVSDHDGNALLGWNMRPRVGHTDELVSRRMNRFSCWLEWREAVYGQ